MKNKRGLSTIVVTLIILVITLVSVGILYAIYTNILNQNKGQVDIQTKCLEGVINIASTTCKTGGVACNVYVEKGLTATDTPDKVKISFIDNAGVTSADTTLTYATTLAIPIAGTKTAAGANLATVTKVRVIPQFTVSGVDKDCAMVEKVV